MNRGATIVVINSGAGYTAPQGSTVFTRNSYVSHAQAYRVNPTDLLNEATAHTKYAGQLYAQSRAGYDGLASQILTQQKELDELYARGAVAQQALGLVQPQARQYAQQQPQSQGYVIQQNAQGRTEVKPLPPTTPPAGPVPPGAQDSQSQEGEFDMTASAMEVIQARCISCHGSEPKDNDLGLDKFGDHQYAAQERDGLPLASLVIARTLGELGAKPEKPRMPLDKEPLNQQQLSALFAYELQLRYEGLIGR